MIAIIDYGAGNLSSVKKALDYLGAESKITQDSDEILSASHVILPGVGSFADAMNSMRERNLVEVVRRAALTKRFLGICLGLQLLFDGSEESPDAVGLGILKGKIVKIPGSREIKVPHIGWNSVELKQNDGIFKDIEDGGYFYFVHSFYLTDADTATVAATAQYGTEIQCAVQSGKLAAVQFHPEKSGALGLKLLKNFVESEG